jgi:hypothetical protein
MRPFRYVRSVKFSAIDPMAFDARSFASRTFPS